MVEVSLKLSNTGFKRKNSPEVSQLYITDHMDSCKWLT